MWSLPEDVAATRETFFKFFPDCEGMFYNVM
jgi:hypothetical protein